jgi:hypothetical protein
MPDLGEIKGDILALGPAITQAQADFTKLESEIDAAAKSGAGALTRLHDYPYKVQLTGAAVDHVPLRTVEARVFQTRFTRILYDASRYCAELVHPNRRAAAVDLAARRQAFDATREALQQFTADWEAFAKKY